MLTNVYAPCFPNKKVTKIKLQAKVVGFELDDIVVFLEDRDTQEEHRLLTQVKHVVSVTDENKTFNDVNTAAWKDFNNPSCFRKSKDKMALITWPISATDIENVRAILDWAYGSGKDYVKYFENVEKANFSSDAKRKKLKAFEHHLKIAYGGTSISQNDFLNS